MSGEKKIYTKEIEGYLCAFDSVTNICVDVMLATGMDVNVWKKFRKKTLGVIDPDCKK